MEHTIKARLAILRGNEYYWAWFALWDSEDCAAAKADVEARRRVDITVIDLVEMADAHGLPFKPFVRSLENDKVIKRGTFDQLPPLTVLRRQIIKHKARQASDLPVVETLRAETGGAA